MCYDLYIILYFTISNIYLQKFFEVFAMFGFKAHFWNERVYIGGRSYLSNEILTALLNLSVKDLEKTLEELRRLRHKVQLEEGGDADFCEGYDKNVQRAQNLFYLVGNIAKSMPPYNSLDIANRLDSPLLFDCLNKYFIYWDDDGDDSDDAEGDPEDYANDSGFVIKDEGGNYRFYTHHFTPDWMTLDSQDSYVVLAIQKTNEEICKLFDAFITFLEDVLRVRTAYTELMEKYIHSKRKYLSDSETAECFTRYLRATEKKSSAERVASSGSMRMSYEVFHLPDGAERLCETYEFDSLGAFLYVDFFRGLGRCHVPKRCDNCGRYFLLSGGKYSSYCERPLKDEPDKTCREIGARKRYDDKCRTDPVWLAYNRAYKAHYARYMKKKMTTAQFEQWSRYAVELREQVERHELPQTEFERLLKI